MKRSLFPLTALALLTFSPCHAGLIAEWADKPEAPNDAWFDTQSGRGLFRFGSGFGSYASTGSQGMDGSRAYVYSGGAAFHEGDINNNPTAGLSEFTVAVSFRPDSGNRPDSVDNHASGANKIIDSTFLVGGSNANGWSVAYTENKVWFTIKDDGLQATITRSIPDMRGEWFTVVATWRAADDFGDPQFSLQLQPANSVDPPVAPTPNPNVVALESGKFGEPRGAGPLRVAPNFFGRVADIEIYDHYATREEIGLILTSIGGKSLFPITEVTSRADSGAGSLRQAITTAADNIPATIRFASGLTQVATTSPILIRNKAVAIEGQGSNLVQIAKAGPAGGVFRIGEEGLPSSVVMRQLDIRGGDVTPEVSFPQNSGGGVFLTGSRVLLRACRLRDNKADSGGGVLIGEESIGWLHGCAVIGGSATFRGGGVSSKGGLRMDRTTLEGSAAVEGAGLYIESGPSVVQSSTIAGNTASGDGGGVFKLTDSAVFKFCTISDNSSGVFTDFDQTALRSCVVAGNGGSNMALGEGASAVNSTFGGTIDSGDPQLDPLRNNGGRNAALQPRTMAPGAGSPAVDAAGAGVRLSDQRGTRIFGDADVGATERTSLPGAAGTEFGTVRVEQLDAGNTSDSVALSFGYGPTRGLRIDSDSSSRGDFHVDLPVFDEVGEGAFITSIAEHGRDNSAAGEDAGTFRATSSAGRNGARYYVAASKAGATGEANIDTSFGWFPFDQWLAGTAINGGGSTAIDLLLATPGIDLGDEFTANNDETFALDLTGMGGSASDGVLLVNVAANDDNYAASKANADGTFTIYNHDNDENAEAYERGPVGFVYMTASDLGTGGLTAFGRVNDDGTTDVAAGAFSVKALGSGRWALAVPGLSAQTATLLISGEGGGARNPDNILSAEWDAAGGSWIIESRDLPGLALQGAVDDAEDMFSFAVFAAPRTLVTTTEDVVSFDGEVSLREALNDSVDGEVIGFDPSVLDAGAVIALSETVNNQLQIKKDIVLTGAGVSGGVTVDARGNGHRVFRVFAEAEAVLEDLVITGGVESSGDGGGVANEGGLLIRRCTIHGKSAQNGGGLSSGVGRLEIWESLISSNSAAGGSFDGRGGGVFVEGSDAEFVMGNSSVVGNKSVTPLTLGGGGLSIGAAGTGRFMKADIYQCTIADNSSTAGGGGFSIGAGVFDIDKCTFVGNSAASPAVGGGISVGVGSTNTVNLTDSIISENTPDNVSGMIDSDVGNLIGGPALLSPLGFYGGPTPTMPPLADSPAIDAATVSDPDAKDQRGMPRVVGTAADIGAAEAQTLRIATVATAVGFDPATNPVLELNIDAAPGLPVMVEASTSLAEFDPITTVTEPGTLEVRLRPGRDFVRTRQVALCEAGLTAYWDFEGDFLNHQSAMGGTEGETLDATAIGDTALAVEGILGQAASFDGAGDYLDIVGEVVEDDPDTSYTISAWFKADTPPAGEDRQMIFETTPTFAISVGLREGDAPGDTEIQFFAEATTGANPNFETQVSDADITGSWFHVVMSYDQASGSLRGYVNGVAIGGATIGATKDFDGFHIGSHRTPTVAPLRFFDGLIDEVAVWNRPLSPAEIALLYNGGNPEPILP